MSNIIQLHGVPGLHTFTGLNEITRNDIMHRENLDTDRRFLTTVSIFGAHILIFAASVPYFVKLTKTFCCQIIISI